MGDCISRQAVLTYIEFILTHGMGKKKSFEFIKKYVERQPSVTPKQKMGHWIWQTEDIYRCSECGEDVHVKEVMHVPQYEFCPNRGAKMEVEE